MSELTQGTQVVSDRSSGLRTQLAALTGLRFIAALAVVLDHYATVFIWWDPAKSSPSAMTPAPRGWSQLLHGGGTGVDCFFVLSGFILAYTYATPAGTLRGSRRSFWVARIARIYPVFLVGLGLDTLLFFERSHHLGSLLAGLGATPLLLQAWIPSLNTWNSWNPPGWSLSVEAFFYLLFPFILVGLAGRSRRILWASAVAAVIILAAVPAVLIYLVDMWRPLFGWTLDQVLYYNPLMRLPEFTLGVSLGLLYVGGHGHLGTHNTSVTSPLTRITRWDVILVTLGLAVAGAQFLPLPTQYPISAVAAPIFAVAIFLVASRQSVISSMLSWRGCVWLGEVSYGIYILHVPIWGWLTLVGLTLLHLAPAAPVLLPLYFASVLALAGLSYRFIERPARKAIRARWDAREARHNAANASSQLVAAASEPAQ